MSEDEAKIADGKQWAVMAAMQGAGAAADIARGLASPSHHVIRGHLQNARNQLREAEENLTRALITIETVS